MKRKIGTLTIGLMLSAFGMPAADNSLGTWKRNIEKSKYNPMPQDPYKSQTMVREASGNGVKVTVTGERKDGTPADVGLYRHPEVHGATTTMWISGQITG